MVRDFAGGRSLAISVLVGGILYGRRPDCILRTDLDWPPEWRLRAAACHRALAAGCQDDLDLAVRVASLYQTAGAGTAEDRRKWCRTWWVNESALATALDAVSSTVGNLSAAMKGKADRPMSPGLIPRARAALTRAFNGSCFRRADDGTFHSEGGEEPVSATLPERRLAGSADRVIAFKRYENTRDPANPQRHISHLVNVIDWAAQGAGVSDGGFDLLLELSNRRQGPSVDDTYAADPLAHIRDKLPIGAVAQFELVSGPGGFAKIAGFALRSDPFLGHANPTSNRLANLDDDDDPGFDRDWELNPREDPIPDDAEDANKPIDPREHEENDSATASSTPTMTPRSEGRISRQTPVFARLMFDDAPPEPTDVYVISDYSIDDGHVFLLLEPVNGADHHIDPAKHDSFHLLDEVEVEFLGTAEDSYWSFFQFRHRESHQRFDVPAKGFFSLDPFVETPARGLTPGHLFRCVVFAPRPGQRSITLKPWLRAQFDKAGAPQRAREGQASRLYSAVIVADPDDRDNVMVELEDIIDPGDIALRTQVWSRWLGEEKGILAAVGQRLRVGFEDFPDRKAALKPVTEKLEAKVAKSGDRLEVRGEKVVATRPLDINLARQLIRLDSDEKWGVAVSDLLDRSQAVRTSVALAPIRRSTLAASNLASSLLREQRIEFEQRYNVRSRLDDSGEVEISTQDELALRQAYDALTALDSAARISARLPEKTAGLVIGRKNQNRLALQSRMGIDWVWVDDGVVHVVGDSLTSVRKVIASINQQVCSATGIVSVPTEQIGLFIGTGGANIQKSSSASGCRADQIGKSGDFRITGPSADSLERFVSIAQQHARGLSFRLTSASQLTILNEKKRSSPATPKEAPVRTNQPQRPRKSSGAGETQTTNPQPRQQNREEILNESVRSRPPVAAREETSERPQSFWSRVARIFR